MQCVATISICFIRQNKLAYGPNLHSALHSSLCVWSWTCHVSRTFRFHMEARKSVVTAFPTVAICDVGWDQVSWIHCLWRKLRKTTFWMTVQWSFQAKARNWLAVENQNHIRAVIMLATNNGWLYELWTFIKQYMWYLLFYKIVH